MSTNPDTVRKNPPRPAAAKARDKAKAVQERAKQSVEAGVQRLEDNPLAALAGAIAVGAVAAAIIPASRRELATIGPIGERVKDAMGEAFRAAKSAGAEQLTASGMTATAATSGLGVLAGHLVTAALSATNAAGSSVRKPRTSAQPSDGATQNSAPQGS